MSLISPIVSSAIFCIGYLIADFAALSHEMGEFASQPWNASFALSLAFTLRYGRRWLVLAALAPLCSIALRSGLSADPVEAVFRAVLEPASALAALAVLQGRSIGLLHPRELIRLIAACLVGAIALSVADAVKMALASGHTPLLAAEMAVHLALSNSVAVLSIAPILVVFTTCSPRALRDVDLALFGETILQAAALILIAWEVFGRFVNQEIHFFYLLFLPFAWIAARHGQKGVALALAALYLAPLTSDAIFGHKDEMILELQIRLGVLAITSLFLGALVSERRQAALHLQERQTELAHFQRLNVGREMASALAHELNQPLTAAMNLTQAALRLLKSPAPDIERVSRIMEKSVDRIERTGEIIHGLRDFMRKGELTLSSNQPSALVEDAIRLISGEAQAAGITLDTAHLGHLHPILADRTQIVQVLVNLLRNSLQSLSDSKTPQPRVEISARQTDGMIELSVADNGPGLAPEILDRLFEPFVTTKTSGMGLGLSISKTILEAHGGGLRAANRADGGAIFRLTLPIFERSVAHE